MFIELLKAVLYGIVEGISEWLPISSTGHLILFEEFLGFNVGADAGLGSEFVAEFLEMFSVVIQLGAILAVVVSFFGRLVPFGKNKSESDKRQTWSLWFKVLVASIPAAAVGIVFDKILEKISGKDIDGWLYNAYVVAAALIIYGILFIVLERVNKNRTVDEINSIAEISYKKALLVGVFQMLAMIPGTSRSGSTILGSVLAGFSRSTAAEFSFYMAIPVMAGASLVKGYGFFDYVSESAISIPADAWLVLTVGCVTAFAVSMVSIRFLTDFVKKHSFAPFGVYRIILGALVLAYFVLHG